jgi:hypothetical protein
LHEQDIRTVGQTIASCGLPSMVGNADDGKRSSAPRVLLG